MLAAPAGDSRGQMLLFGIPPQGGHAASHGGNLHRVAEALGGRLTTGPVATCWLWRRAYSCLMRSVRRSRCWAERSANPTGPSIHFPFSASWGDYLRALPDRQYLEAIEKTLAILVELVWVPRPRTALACVSSLAVGLIRRLRAYRAIGCLLPCSSMNARTCGRRGMATRPPNWVHFKAAVAPANAAVAARSQPCKSP